MRPDLELLAALLVDVRRAQHRELLDACRQRNRPAYLRTGALRRPDDLRGRLVEHPVIEGLRSEEHTSELQSLMRISYAVFCLKKKILQSQRRSQIPSLTSHTHYH